MRILSERLLEMSTGSVLPPIYGLAGVLQLELIWTDFQYNLALNSFNTDL